MQSLVAADAAFGSEGDIAALLEFKGGEPPSFDTMADLLERMCKELGEQFETFQRMRGDAERLAASGLPEAELKLAKADLKAAVDALSIIVRTLEKVDQLQRQIARDRAEEEAKPENQQAYDQLWTTVEELIEARVEERLRARLAGVPEPAAPAERLESDNPPDAGEQNPQPAPPPEMEPQGCDPSP